MPGQAPDPDRHSCFPPVADRRTRVLVLGSLPGRRSLADERYYAHPRNHFWRLIGSVIGREIVALGYADRVGALLSAGVGLWDVVASAQRPGSLDASIRAPATNDLAALATALPALRAVGFNGGTAARIGRAAFADTERISLLTLPSSSPAYTLPFDAKRAEWDRLRAYLT